MRLDKLTIGSAKDSPTHQFKNLKNVTIDFDQDEWVTVVIGWNGTGKSNVLEALAIIFRELIHGKKPDIEFAFKLQYRMGAKEKSRYVHIDCDPDRESELFIIHVASYDEAHGVGMLAPFLEGDMEPSALRGKQIKLNALLNEEEGLLPKYVFGYYSGDSKRMHEVFRPYLESFDKKLRNGEDPGLKRLFYALPVHSQFVLLAFLIQQPKDVRNFLNEHLGLDPDEGVESVLFVLRQPPWKSNAPDGDPRFWKARGVVRDFLARLYDIALAPISVTRQVSVSLWNNKNLEFKYLYVKDIESLRELVGSQQPAEFFRDLESTYVSELIEEVRIKVRLRKNDGTVTFRELSEGEQQLLTVLGLMRFTAEEESLYLLDEPDTHLNPKWNVDYIRYLKKFASNKNVDESTSHIVLTSHNPLAIAELTRKEVQILHREGSDGQGNVISQKPAFDPRGMGYAGIITSDMFGLASALDSHTQELLEKKRKLTLTEGRLSPKQKEELGKINLELDGYGFRYSSRDPIFEEYLKARYTFDKGKPKGEKLVDMSSEDRTKVAKRLLDEVMQRVNKGAEE